MVLREWEAERGAWWQPEQSSARVRSTAHAVEQAAPDGGLAGVAVLPLALWLALQVSNPQRRALLACSIAKYPESIRSLVGPASGQRWTVTRSERARADARSPSQARSVPSSRLLVRRD